MRWRDNFSIHGQPEKTLRTLQIQSYSGRDRLVCGVRDKRIQQRLLAETDLTLQRAIELAFAVEAATLNSQELQASKTQKPETLLKVQHSRTSQK